MLNICKGITKKNESCRKKTSGEFCHIHLSQKIIEKTTHEVKSINKVVVKKNRIISDLNNLIDNLEDKIDNVKYKKTELEYTIEELNEEIENKNKIINRQNKIVEKYEIIVKFEKLKTTIKNVYNFDNDFYIEDIKNNKKYHKKLEKILNNSIDEIIKNYYELREKRNKFAHSIFLYN